MSYEQRLDTLYRPVINRVSAEPLAQRGRPETAVTGAEKSTALAELETARTASMFPGDREGSGRFVASDTNLDNQPLSFSDLIDVINPLQHIPLLSSAYRAMTGDEISAPARVAGSTLFFGPIGAASAATNLITAEITGKDVGEHFVSLFTDDVSDDSLPETLETVNAVGVGAGGDSAADIPAAPVIPDKSDDPAEPLSPDAPFSFGLPEAASVPEPRRVIGFAGSAEPVALESLPPDILSALYSGQTVRPVSAAGSSGNDNLTPEVTDASALNPQNHANAVEATPRWSLWSTPDGALPSRTSAIDTYGGIMPVGPAGAGDIISQAGWAAATAPEVLARYQDSVNLQKQPSKSYLDISQ